MHPHLRIARPVSDLEQTASLYRKGLGFVEIGRFRDHEGFDGVMLGKPGLPYHFEFTHCRYHPVNPSPTEEDLLVFYFPDPGEWEIAWRAMEEAGFTEVAAFNPYWGKKGKTYADRDGYRVVIQQAAWPA